MIWSYNIHTTVESSSFGSELVALRIATELVEDLRYKLRCLSIPLDGPANIFCDNKDVVMNVSGPTLMSNKRHNAIFYHHMQGLKATGKIQVKYSPG